MFVSLCSGSGRRHHRSSLKTIKMEYPNLILPLTKNICRTCLAESDSTMEIQDLIEYETINIKLIDILVYINCLENNDEENWPQGLCSTCVSTALVAYTFKLNCLKANTMLSHILNVQSSPINLHRSDMDNIDINVVYQDHGYDLSLFGNNPSLDFDSMPVNKELTPLPPVSEITSAEQLPRKEGDKKYACTICSRSFTRIYSLRYHMSKHTDVRKYLCSICGIRFHTANGLRQHLISHKEVAQFKCGFCNKTYKSRQSLKEHFRIAHSSNSKLFFCVTCDKKFTTKSTLMMHIRSHSGEKQFACPHCPKKYTRSSYLKAHLLVHTGQLKPRPFVCRNDKCDRNFSTKHSLLIHIAYCHSAERPHKCEVCFKGFATKSGLRIHRESHNSKEISCDICCKKLGNKRLLQKHKKEHDDSTTDMILETVVDDVFFDQIY